MIAILTILIFHSDYLFKIVIIGDAGVGKSALLLRFSVNSVIYSRMMNSVKAI
jgi:GTPase SAR1 family protein